MGVNGAWIAAAIGATATVAQADDSSRRAGHAKDDAEAARKQAEITASTNANARISMQRKAMQQNSLITGGGAAAPDGSGGRQSLGV